MEVFVALLIPEPYSRAALSTRQAAFLSTRGGHADFANFTAPAGDGHLRTSAD